MVFVISLATELLTLRYGQALIPNRRQILSRLNFILSPVYQTLNTLTFSELCKKSRVFLLPHAMDIGTQILVLQSSTQLTAMSRH
jgi:hypothetical protein